MSLEEQINNLFNNCVQCAYSSYNSHIYCGNMISNLENLVTKKKKEVNGNTYLNILTKIAEKFDPTPNPNTLYYSNRYICINTQKLSTLISTCLNNIDFDLSYNKKIIKLFCFKRYVLNTEMIPFLKKLEHFENNYTDPEYSLYLEYLIYTDNFIMFLNNVANKKPFKTLNIINTVFQKKFINKNGLLDIITSHTFETKYRLEEFFTMACNSIKISETINLDFTYYIDSCFQKLEKLIHYDSKELLLIELVKLKLIDSVKYLLKQKVPVKKITNDHIFAYVSESTRDNYVFKTRIKNLYDLLLDYGYNITHNDIKKCMYHNIIIDNKIIDNNKIIITNDLFEYARSIKKFDWIEQYGDMTNDDYVLEKLYTPNSYHATCRDISDYIKEKNFVPSSKTLHEIIIKFFNEDRTPYKDLIIKLDKKGSYIDINSIADLYIRYCFSNYTKINFKFILDVFFSSFNSVYKKIEIKEDKVVNEDILELEKYIMNPEYNFSKYKIVISRLTNSPIDYKVNVITTSILPLLKKITGKIPNNYLDMFIQNYNETLSKNVEFVNNFIKLSRIPLSVELFKICYNSCIVLNYETILTMNSLYINKKESITPKIEKTIITENINDNNYIKLNDSLITNPKTNYEIYKEIKNLLNIKNNTINYIELRKALLDYLINNDLIKNNKITFNDDLKKCLNIIKNLTNDNYILFSDLDAFVKHTIVA